MIAQIRGLVLEKNLTSVVVDVSGVGYELFVSVQTLQKIPPKDEKITLYTHLHVREDAMLLFGFSSLEEKIFFERCISISGVGPKLALAILSGHDLETTVAALKQGDLARLTKIPGIGKKTAERLVMELREKLDFFASSTYQSQVSPDSNSFTGQSPRDKQILIALCQLGYKTSQAEAALKAVLVNHAQSNVEEILRQSLAFLQRA